MCVTRRISYVSIVAVLCFAPLALAQYSMTLTGANPNGFSNGGVYVSPYTATITNGATTVYNGYVICDDYATESLLNSTWDVNVSPVSPLNGTEKFSIPNSTYYDATKSAQDDYDAAAYLAVQLLANMNNYNLASAYSYAIWTIFDSAALSHYVGTQSDVTNLITDAFAQTASGYNGPNVMVYSPVPSSASQEFLVVQTVQTPEPSTLVNLAFDLTALLGVIFVVRRRMLRSRLMAPAART